MYYTPEMRRAFNSVPKPNSKLRMEVLDNEHFLVLRLDTSSLRGMTGEEQKESVIYAIKVKKALEQAGANVLVTREPEQRR